MQDLFNQRMDQAGSPGFRKIQIDRLLNWGYDIWYIINRKKFNRDQSNTVNMTHLLRPFTFENTSIITVVGDGTNIPDFRDLAKMKGQWQKTDCRGKLMFWAYDKSKPVLADRNIVSVPLSKVDVQTQDPFNQANDEYPFYKHDNNGTNRVITIQSTTVPLKVTGTYFKILQTIDTIGAPDTPFEAQDYVARQVVDIAKILGKGDVDDYPAVKQAMGESELSQVVTP